MYPSSAVDWNPNQPVHATQEDWVITLLERKAA